MIARLQHLLHWHCRCEMWGRPGWVPQWVVPGEEWEYVPCPYRPSCTTYTSPATPGLHDPANEERENR